MRVHDNIMKKMSDVAVSAIIFTMFPFEILCRTRKSLLMQEVQATVHHPINQSLTHHRAMMAQRHPL